jgi:hypothetical protein
MKTLTELFSYIAAIGLIVVGLAGGSVWLLKPDSSMRAEAKAPIVPQKFLDSIERKKPVPADIVAPVSAAQPVLQEAPASLPQPALRRQTIREVSSPAPKAKKRQSASRPHEVSVAPTTPANFAPVTTSRTDFPY